jgi:Dienelactone hydrolase family
MELVEGPTLADRIAQAAIPLAEARPIAKQIAEGGCGSAWPRDHSSRPEAREYRACVRSRRQGGAGPSTEFEMKCRRSIVVVFHSWQLSRGDRHDGSQHNPDENNESATDLSRRDFVALTLASGLTAATDNIVSAAEMPVQVTNVDVKTPDATCDATFIHPTSGSHPSALIWADAFGLRPAMVDIGKRIAAEGYSVLVPNPYYRMTKAPGIDTSNFSFQN